MTTPRSSIAFGNHFVHGAFESREFDPGGEIVASTDPFYRNRVEGIYAMELSERLGGEISGSFNRVEFTEPVNDFFQLRPKPSSVSRCCTACRLLPVSSASTYARQRVPTRPDPQAESDANVVLFGLRGEVTPLLIGRVRVGYTNQTSAQSTAQRFSGFVADVSLKRQFGTASALGFTLGRRTSPSSFQENGFYVSNYGTAQFVAPIVEKLRFSATAAFFGSNYPLADVATGIDRRDITLSGGVGVAYFWTPLSYLSVDYRHDRRDSDLDRFSYRNNAVQFMVGFGFLSR